MWYILTVNSYKMLPINLIYILLELVSINLIYTLLGLVSINLIYTLLGLVPSFLLSLFNPLSVVRHLWFFGGFLFLFSLGEGVCIFILCPLMPSEQYFRYINKKTSYISMS